MARCLRNLVVLGCLIASVPAVADTVVLGATRDNSIYSNDGAKSNGAGQNMFVGINNDAFQRRALLQFDIAGSVPAGSTINSVTLTLYLTRTQVGNVSIGLHTVKEAWGEAGSVASGEGGGGGSAQTNDATWTKRLSPSTTWTTDGGSYASAASATTTVANAQGTYSWSSAQMTADVQGWLTTPSTNFGWILVGNSTSRSTKRFGTRTNSNASYRPKLTINFTPPAVSGACCAANGSCSSVLSPGTGCSGTYLGGGTSCSPNPCPQPQPMGACCAANATCSYTTEASCGGTWQGELTSCPLTQCPFVLTPFVDPLPIPPVAKPTSAGNYTMSMVQFTHKMHSNLPPTTLWGFDDGNGPSSPGPTIEARTGEPINVLWKNDLRDADGNLRKTHVLQNDHCLSHEAMPKTVVHLHGGHVPAAVDGYPDFAQPPGEEAMYAYPNNQPAGTLWYHDHAMGITRLNVMMGLAGMYLVRDPDEDALGLPAGENEIPLVIQDKSFDSSGQLFYPEMWHDHFMGDTIVVNGIVWPYLQVKRGMYRFRVVNGSSSRTYTLALSNGAKLTIIGTDGGLLAAPVPLGELTIMPGERADLVIDFSSYAAGTEIVLTNSAPMPFPGPAGEGVIPNVMKFVVTSATGHTTPLPTKLSTVEPIDQSAVTVTRDLVLKKRNDDCTGSIWSIDGRGWNDITEQPILGSTEIWRFLNDSGISHPMHMHLVQFQILDRTPFVMMNGVPVATGEAVKPPTWEQGWKDTVAVGPNEIARVIVRFTDYTGRFPYHCHILEHEDHDMMRQFEVVEAPGQDGTQEPPKDGGCCQATDDPPFGQLSIALAILFVSRRRRR